MLLPSKHEVKKTKPRLNEVRLSCSVPRVLHMTGDGPATSPSREKFVNLETGARSAAFRFGGRSLELYL